MSARALPAYVLLIACRQQEFSLDDRPCDERGACVSGYVCDAQRKLCVSEAEGDPPFVTDLRAAVGDTRITLSFTFPSAFFDECQVLRKQGEFPTGAGDLSAFKISDHMIGAGVVEVVDAAVVNGISYSYLALCRVGRSWSDDVHPSGAAINATTATPLDHAPQNPTDFSAGDGEPERSTLRFTMPPAPVSECQVRRDSVATPQTHDAGTLAGAALLGQGLKRFTEAGLTGGVTYFYAVFCRFGTTWNDSVTSASSDTALPN